MMKQVWQAYLTELKGPALVGPGLRTNLPANLRQSLHVLFITFRYLGFYLLYKPIGYLIVFLTADLRVRGRENIPSTGGFVGTVNHLSNYDPLIGGLMSYRPLYAMVKTEYFTTPILGGIVIALGGFPVRRGEADRQAVRTAVAIVKRNGILSIFPEGTRSKTFTLQEGHSGAALIAATSDATVLPVAIAGTENIMRRRKWGFLHRPRIDFVIGKPYNLKAEAQVFAAAHDLAYNSDGKRSRHNDLEFMSDIMMLKIAELLPSEYRGEFTLDGVIKRYQARAIQKSKNVGLTVQP